MTEAAPAPPPAPPPAPTAEPAADGTRNRVLRAGLQAFAREGYAGATTRMIAAAAGVTLPTISYHFGSKDGLHRACAEAIVDAYRQQMLGLVVAARDAVDSGGVSAAAAVGWLSRILDALVAALAADTDDRLATDFVLRELSEPGPGYALLLRELWSPGITLVADLIARARGHSSAGEADRTAALMLLASLGAFTTQAPISFPLLGWQAVGPHQRAAIQAQAQLLLAGLLAGQPAAR